MTRKIMGPAALCLILVPSLVLGLSEPVNSTWSVKEALDIAIDDERHAIAYYEAVMAKHGERRPFSNIVHAERRHEAALLAQYERLGHKPPTNQWLGKRIDVPDSFIEACDASSVAEIRNGRIYDRLIATIKDEQVRDVFERLRWASIERHLRAFRRHGSGWTQVKQTDLTPKQVRQSDKALDARTTMFSDLLGELMKALQKGGANNAIDVCSQRALVIAKSTGEKHGVKIGRTSWKLRNPQNQPPVWAALLVDERVDETCYMADNAGRLGVLTPIHLSGTCLKCHGGIEGLAPGVREHLDAHYPRDMATGFKEGELRGWFWVEVPQSQS